MNRKDRGIYGGEIRFFERDIAVILLVLHHIDFYNKNYYALADLTGIPDEIRLQPSPPTTRPQTFFRFLIL